MPGVREFELPTLEAPVGLQPFLGPEAVVPVAPQIDLEAEAAAARAAGHAEGFAAGHADAVAQLAPIFEALRAAAVGVDAERERVAAVFEREAVDLALAVAEQVLSGALDVEPERVVDVVRGALRRLVERERVTVLVHPDDLDLVRDATGALIAELGGMEHLEVQAERRVARGGALVRTVEGDVDATIATKLAKVRELVVDTLGPGPSPVPGDGVVDTLAPGPSAVPGDGVADSLGFVVAEPVLPDAGA